MRTDEMKELGTQIVERFHQLDLLTHELLVWIAEFDRQEAWRDEGQTSMPHWLSYRCRISLGTAYEKVRVARKLAELPAISAAVKTGAVTYSLARELTRIATPATEAAALAMALRLSPSDLVDEIRAELANQDGGGGGGDRPRAVRTSPLPGGMVKLELVLSAAEAELVMAAIEQAIIEDREPEFSTGESGPGDLDERAPMQHADGLVVVVDSFLRGTSPDRSPTEVVLTIRPGEPARFGAKGRVIPDETARRLGCDAGVVVLVEDEQGAPLSVSERTRTVPTWMQRALRHRDHHCRFPGCRNRRWLAAHHLIHWADGGPTTLENLALICTHHHAYVHEHGIRVEMGAHQRPYFFDRRGTPIAEVIAPPLSTEDAVHARGLS